MRTISALVFGLLVAGAVAASGVDASTAKDTLDCRPGSGNGQCLECGPTNPNGIHCCLDACSVLCGDWCSNKKGDVWCCG